MAIEFDARKDAANRRKHGLSLALAERMDLGTAVIDRDLRRDYGEDRFQALGMIGGRLHLLAYTLRHGALRAISLRKANDREQRRYVQSTRKT